MTIQWGSRIRINDKQSEYHGKKAIVQIAYYDKRGEFSHCIAKLEGDTLSLKLTKEQVIVSV